MKVITSVAAVIALLMPIPLLAAPTPPHCGELGNKFQPPNDYNDPEHKKHLLILVEIAHFTPNVENLQYGNTGTLAGDLSYTLKMFPNHPRALEAFGKLSIRDK